jgi:hypothetical protein
MNSRKLIWGSFLILIGLLLVIHNFGIMPLSINWGRLASLWPLILIILGLNSLSKNTNMNPWVFNGSAAIIITIFIYQVVDFSGTKRDQFFDWSDDANIETDSVGLKTQDFVLPLDSGVSKAKLSFEGGAAKFILNDTTSSLIDARTLTQRGEYSLEKVRTDSSESIKMKLTSSNFNIKNGKIDNKVEVKLNPRLDWDFNFEIGAGAIDFDFSNYKVSKINLDAGAASIDMKLSGKVAVSNVDIDAGASSVTLRVPKEARCRVKMDAILSSESLPGFSKKKNGYYESDNYNGKGNLININVDAGMSSVTIERY